MNPLAFGPPSPPALLVGLVALAAALLVARVLLGLAWRLVIIAILVVTALWILGLVGMGPGLVGLLL